MKVSHCPSIRENRHSGHGMAGSSRRDACLVPGKGCDYIANHVDDVMHRIEVFDSVNHGRD
ncbi:MAG: hypothetical protein HY356_03425 [Gammaproteobacteria bacterium]|nr:hypothetical protein [Gammaproteobacteria bacterium]